MSAVDDVMAGMVGKDLALVRNEVYALRATLVRIAHLPGRWRSNHARQRARDCADELELALRPRGSLCVVRDDEPNPKEPA